MLSFSSSRRSHSFAICQSRVTVSVEMPSAAAISSFFSPPKKRSSTTRAFRSSFAASEFERVIEGNEIRTARRHRERFVERDVDRAAAALLVASGARRVDEDPPHLTGREHEEVGPVLPVHLIEVHQPQVDLVDERRGRSVWSGRSPRR